MPWHDTVQFDLQREAQERPHEHDEAQRRRTLERLLDGDRQDDVGDDEDFQAQQDRPTDVVAQRDIGGPTLACPEIPCIRAQAEQGADDEDAESRRATSLATSSADE